MEFEYHPTKSQSNVEKQGIDKQARNKFLQSDQIVLSCLLPNAQKPRQHALVAAAFKNIDKYPNPAV